MEKPSAAPLLLGAGALVVVVALGVLVVKVRASAPPPDLAPQEIASAQARMGSSRIDAPAVPSVSSSSTTATPRRGGLIGAPAGMQLPAQRADDEAPDPTVIPSPEVAREGQDDSGEEEAAGGTSKQVEANRLYDRGDYEGAAELAEEILKDDPDNARVLRIAASSACVMGDADKAKGYHARLSPRDQRKIARRCQRYGIEF